MTKEKITKKMTLEEVVNKYPETIEPMLRYGLHCLGCFAANMETLEQGGLAHGMSEEEVDMMVKKLNKVVEENEKEKGRKV